VIEGAPLHWGGGGDGVSEGVAVEGEEGGPVETGGDGGGLAPGRKGALVRHLEEQELGQLLDVVAVGETVVAEDVAGVPEFGDELLGVVGGHEHPRLAVWRGVSTPRSTYEAPPGLRTSVSSGGGLAPC